MLLLVAASALGQYNYQKPAAPPAPPTTPRGTYLPPKNEQQEQIAGEGLSPDVSLFSSFLISITKELISKIKPQVKTNTQK